ncbi:MAG: hypothetical protein SF052_05990 [Bacteroidia bacterium]|nr:hypothetical protein [Bacteroidia bacterium]
MSLFSILPAQNDPLIFARKSVYEGYLTGKAIYWETGIKQMILQVDNTPTFRTKLELAKALYGKIGFEISRKEEEAAGKVADQVLKLLEPMVEENDKSAEAHAILGSVYALKIAMSPAKALLLGPKSASHLEEAVSLNPENPVAWCELGNMRLHAPGLFGGDVEKAIDCFSKAVRLFEKKQEPYHWQYLHALVWLGKAYEAKAEWGKAYEAYQYALSKEPGLRWVREELLPEARQKSGN